MSVEEKFIRYVQYDTQSDASSQTIPSTKKQLVLADALKKECEAMGFDRVVEKQGTVYAFLKEKGTLSKEAIGFVAHMDTASEISGKNVKPKIIRDYDGQMIHLNETYSMDPDRFPSLKKVKHEDLIVTDGTTLLGGDDKAGIAIIMQAMEELIHSDQPHGPVAIAFTPDEEIGRGVEAFDLKEFPVDFAYTIDGDRIDAIDYETFNAAEAIIDIQGVSIHPGDAKDRMVNAALLAIEFASMLPKDEIPSKTEGREGFYHLLSIEGECEHAKLVYLLREHDVNKFENQMETIQQIAKEMNAKYNNRIEAAIRKQYSNMKEYMHGDLRSVHRAEEAIRKAGMEPVHTPVRGGTDGAMLTERGLICPNLGTGSYNHHGRYEFASIPQMKKMVEIVKSILEG
ncbi:peptidase T [Dubosiella newyorkensis]|uniref:peptidase T n=1 Tax=Dubosiella newyorkensis TaxID=1862672 RepID=UPI0023F1D460|nr:peptidase T [Dubosiella newyorkensis]